MEASAGDKSTADHTRQASRSLRETLSAEHEAIFELEMSSRLGLQESSDGLIHIKE